jgi:hypothetical protein
MRVSITKSICGFILGAGVLIGAFAWALAPAAAKEPEKTPIITNAQVIAAQKAWGDGLVDLGNECRANPNGCQAAANQFIRNVYDYQNPGRVFFKPTQAFGPRTFRPTEVGARSYFIGDNPTAFPEDPPGFALKYHWRSVAFENAPNGIQTHGEIAITMGKVHLERSNLPRLTVDKTLVFRRRGNALKICVHHSSLPFQPGE